MDHVNPGAFVSHPDHPNDRFEVFAVRGAGVDQRVDASSRWNSLTDVSVTELSPWGSEDSILFPKRYVLFAHPNYYPRGGALDAIGSFADLEEAVTALPAPGGGDESGRQEFEYAHILDIKTGLIVRAWERQPYHNPPEPWVETQLAPVPWPGTLEDPWETQ